MITAEIRAMAADLAAELSCSRHEVVLVDAPRQRHQSHRVRRAVSFLPEWYRHLMHAVPSSRRDRVRHFQTAIKRRHTISGLKAIAAGRRGNYADLLIAEIDRMIADQSAELQYQESLQP